VTLLVVMRRGSSSWTSALLLLLAGAWALYSARTVPVAAAILALLAASVIQGAVGDFAAPSRKERLRFGLGYTAALGVLALLVPWLTTAGPDHPAWEDEALSDLPAGTVVLNDWQWGGHLMWKHPDLDLVVHGYVDVFTGSELERNIDISKVEPGWDESVESTGARLALVDPDTSLAYELEHMLDWKVVRRSDDVELLRAP